MEGRDQLQGALKVSVRAYLPIPSSKPKSWKAAALSGDVRPTTRPDCDNFAKVVDGLNGIAWHDDAQIVTLVVEKRYSDRPRLELVADEMVGGLV